MATIRPTKGGPGPPRAVVPMMMMMMMMIVICYRISLFHIIGAARGSIVGSNVGIFGGFLGVLSFA